MSKLDDVLVHDPECKTNLTDEYEDCGCVCKGEKKAIKRLILELFKEAEYDPWKFVEKVDEL